MLFNSSVGIEINEFEINVVHLKGSFKGTRLAAVSCLRLDHARPVEDRVMDTVNFINGFLHEEKVAGADIFIGISGEQAMMREVHFPLAVKENLRTTLEYEIEKYIPMAYEDIYFDFQVVVESKEEEKLTVRLVAVRKESLEKYLTIAAQIETGVTGIEIIPAGVSNYFLNQYDMNGKPVMLVYCREYACDIMVLNNRQMVYFKSFMNSGEVSTLDTLPLVRLKEVCLPDDATPDLLLYGIQVSDAQEQSLSRVFGKIDKGPGVEGCDEKYIPAYALALKGMQPVAVSMNLMPVRLRKKPNKTAIYVMFGLVGVLTLVGAVWAGSSMIRQRHALTALDAELARLRSEAMAVERIQEDTDQIRKNIDYLQSLRPGNVFVMDIMEELSRIIPPDAWLTELKLDGDKLNLNGVAESASGLIPLLEQSPFFKKVEFTSVIRKNRDGKEVFRIGCEIQAEK